MNHVAVTGLGAITPIGNSPDTFYAALLAGKSGVRPAPELAIGPMVPLVAAAAFDPATVPTSRRSWPLDRATAMALAAAQQAVADAGGKLNSPPDRRGVYWGTGMGGAGTVDAAYRLVYGEDNWRVKPTTVVTAMNNAATAQISLEFEITGPTLTYSVACASSAVAIGEAMRAIRFGLIDCAIVGGSEALLNRGTVAAWSALRTLAHEDQHDPARSCKPFSADRSGFVLGEGAAAIILENADTAQARGARVYAELAGYGISSDATHIADPSAAGQARAISAALDDAKVEPSSVGYINAHGTATSLGDRVETASIKQALGRYASGVPVSSTKALHGHVMGATGAIEFVAAVLALFSQSIPPTAHLDVPDPELDLDFVPNAPRHGVSLRVVATNSFAFGGTNTVLVAQHPAMRLAPRR